jgi:lipopolysaccharide export system protein LptA
VSVQRIQRTLYSLISVAIAYAGYALVAVPLIEPSLTFTAPSLPPVAASHSRSFERLFPPGSWELERPKVLETEQGTLLFDDYQPLDDQTKMRLTRCTFVRYLESSRPASPKGSAGKPSDKGRPIILRAAAGAILDFDAPLDVAQGEFGKLISGQLCGEVVITSPRSGPNIDDALRFTTRDVQIDARRIWTPHEVDFEYGPNRGQGRDLRVEWTRAAHPVVSDRSSGPALQGIRSLELVHLDRLEIQVPAENLPGGFAALDQRPRAAPQHAGADEMTTTTTSAEVSCQGPLRFDFPRYLASLTDQVHVVRHNLDGPADQLQCELLEIYFSSPNAAPDSRHHSSQKLPALRPVKFVAEGSPASLRIASRGAEAVATRMEYDLAEGVVRMEDQERLRLSDPNYRIETQALEYVLGAAGRIGQFWAKGPGQLWAKAAVQGRDLEAQWETEVQLRRHENSPVFSLVRGAITLAGTERFSAEEMHLFLSEQPRAGTTDSYDVLPERMKAVGNVQLDSTQLVSRVREANLWFTHPGAARTTAATDGSNPASPSGGLPAALGSPDTANETRFDLQAEMLQAQIGLTQPLQIQRLTVQNIAHFRQITGDARQTLSVEGDVFELQDGDQPQARAVLVGRPARIALGEATMSGGEIRLYRAENVVDVIGAGTMTVPVQRNATMVPQTKPSRPLPPMQIGWQGGMHFQGRVARFDRQVVVHGNSQLDNGNVMTLTGRSQSLRVTLTADVDFSRPQASKQLDIHQLAFDTDVFLQTECLDPTGQRTAFQQTEARNLTINQPNGDLRAGGPGWISSVHYREPSTSATGPPPPALFSSTTGIEYLRVHFLREIAGCLPRGEVEFHEGVKAVYGPVADWEAMIPEDRLPGPGDEFVVLTSDRLSVADMSDQPGRFQNVELAATGNALVRGNGFSASAERISYARGKDQVIAEGDGRRDAVLTFQPAQASAKPVELKAGKILYSPSTRQWGLDDFQRLDIDDLNQLRSAPRAR